MAGTNLQETEMKCTQKGFTLVEVIVVLVVLAVLAAILVPSLSGYIDSAKDKAAVAECRACVQATQLLLSESYAQHDLKISVAGAKALAEVEGDITRLDYTSSAKVEHLAYRSSDKVRVVYCAKAGEDSCGNGETYTVGGAMAAADGLVYLDGAPVPDAFLDEAIAGADLKGFTSGSIDSTAPADPALAGNTGKITDYFAENGIDVADFNIQSWAVRKDRNSPAVLWWTDQDISNKNDRGKLVRVICYDPAGNDGAGAYQAGYAKIGKSAKLDYNILDVTLADGGKLTSQVADSKDYGGIISAFNGLEAVKTEP